MRTALTVTYTFGVGFFLVLWLLLRRPEERNRFLKRVYGSTPGFDTRDLQSLRAVLLHCIVIICLLVIGINIGASIIIAISAAFIPSVAKHIRFQKRKTQIDGQVETFLTNLSCALYLDPSIFHGLNEAKNEAGPPMRDEVCKTLAEIEAGAALSDAIYRLSHRVNDEVFEMAIHGITICSETGGDLARYLNSLAQLKRDRARIKGRVKAMASQQKATAKIVAFIPILFIGLIWMANPSFLQYFTSPIGIGAAVYSVISVAIGFVVMNKMGELRPGG